MILYDIKFNSTQKRNTPYISPGIFVNILNLEKKVKTFLSD